MPFGPSTPPLLCFPPPLMPPFKSLNHWTFTSQPKEPDARYPDLASEPPHFLTGWWPGLSLTALTLSFSRARSLALLPPSYVSFLLPSFILIDLDGSFFLSCLFLLCALHSFTSFQFYYLTISLTPEDGSWSFPSGFLLRLPGCSGKPHTHPFYLWTLPNFLVFGGCCQQGPEILTFR